VTVVFDSYNVLTTKDLEQKRRQLMKPQCPDMVVDIQIPAPLNKAVFCPTSTTKKTSWIFSPHTYISPEYMYR
jgi:hypothetical protein